MMRCWCGYLSGVRSRWFAYGPADVTATLSSLASLKVRIVLPFWCWLKRKGKEEYLYSAILVRTHTLKALRYGSHSFTCKLHHACLSFVSIHQMALPLTEVADIKLQLTTCFWPRRDESLSWPGWLTYSGWFTRGHQPATGWAQDREVRRPKTDVIPLCHATNQQTFRQTNKHADRSLDTATKAVSKNITSWNGRS